VTGSGSSGLWAGIAAAIVALAGGSVLFLKRRRSENPVITEESSE
jgi:LPXTG-motif cell wall-anchored protein